MFLNMSIISNILKKIVTILIKKIWSGIREIVNIKNTISPMVAQLNVGGKIIVNPKEIATNLFLLL